MKWEEDEFNQDSWYLKTDDGKVEFSVEPHDYAEDMWNAEIWIAGVDSASILYTFESIEEAKAYIDAIVRSIKISD